MDLYATTAQSYKLSTRSREVLISSGSGFAQDAAALKVYLWCCSVCVRGCGSILLLVFQFYRHTYTDSHMAECNSHQALFLFMMRTS